MAVAELGGRLSVKELRFYCKTTSRNYSALKLNKSDGRNKIKFGIRFSMLISNK